MTSFPLLKKQKTRQMLDPNFIRASNNPL